MIVLAAIHQDGNALEFAAEHLKNDKDIVLAAVGEEVNRDIGHEVVVLLTGEKHGLPHSWLHAIETVVVSCGETLRLIVCPLNKLNGPFCTTQPETGRPFTLVDR